MSPKLQLRNVSKTYDGDVFAVNGIDLEVNAGETVALLGPSGCGKSTTLNMIIGLEEPTSGDIRIDGHSIVGTPPGERNVGLVFQDYAVFTHMSVEKNLAFGPSVRGLPRAEIKRKVAAAADLLGLTPLLQEKAAGLGGSQLQRVAIARTLVTEPDILLLDEPLSNLETEARQTMRQELRRLAKDAGLTIIYVTHDQIEALSLADRVAVMSNGKIRQYDAVDTVYHRPGHTFVAGFIGSPPMNLIRGAIHHKGGAPVFRHGAVDFPLPEGFGHAADGTRAILGIRPEAVTVGPFGDGLPADIVLVEPRGPDTVVTASVADLELTALVPSAEAPLADTRSTLRFDPATFSLFHNDTGINLGTTGGEG
ncbi:MAG: ABC transporter ATP-binding protein [Pseudomonadota bacterium]